MKGKIPENGGTLSEIVPQRILLLEDLSVEKQAASPQWGTLRICEPKSSRPHPGLGKNYVWNLGSAHLGELW